SSPLLRRRVPPSAPDGVLHAEVVEDPGDEEVDDSGLYATGTKAGPTATPSEAPMPISFTDWLN
ncbi:MAG TPA: hypothetical protein VHM69_17445, partial [Rubrobacter sp.]|nr:hypothetical protein [Rubrobacter sp.]